MTDIDHYVIPDEVTLGGLIFSVIISPLLARFSFINQDLQFFRNFFFPELVGILANIYQNMFVSVLCWSLISAAFGWGLLTLIAISGRVLFGKEAMGGGDVKLFAFIGAYFGIAGTLCVLFMSALLGSVVGVFALARHKLLGKDEFIELSLAPNRAVFPPFVNSASGNMTQLRIDEPHKREPAEATASEADTGEKVLTLKLPRHTSGQLRHLPYGPYIAAAAITMLFVYPNMLKLLRAYFPYW